MQFHDTLYGDVKNGVLVLSGYIANVTVEHEMLLVRDGIKGGVIERRFGRAHCPISRLISTQADGYISFDAIRWLHGTGASLAHLNYDGTPLVVSVPRHAVPAALRRKQAALSVESGLGASIARCLIRSKVAGQIEVLRHFSAQAAAAEANAFAARITPHISASELLGIEGMVSSVYWQSLASRPLRFGRRQSVPDHWKSFGARRSTLTGDPRGAVTPGSGMLNYLYSVAASEITIALYAIGLDVSLGILHTDKDNRASLTYDLLETARSILDLWYFHWLQSATFSKRDFIEGANGAVRITRPLSSHLAMTAGLWRGLAEQLAQWFYQCLSTERIPGLKLTFVDVESYAKRRAARWSLGNALQRPVPTTCAECGKALPEKRRKFCSNDCMRLYYGGAPAEAGLAALKRARTARAASGGKRRPKAGTDNAMSRRDWRRQPGWTPTLDDEMRRWFVASLLPALSRVRPADIRRATGLGETYSVMVKHGAKIPHPRLHRLLAEVAGLEYPFAI
jgi:CRISPR-associated endonuclease Cas1